VFSGDRERIREIAEKQTGRRGQDSEEVRE
jgi:hypothetical protein